MSEQPNPVYLELRRIYCCAGAEFSRPTLEKAWKEIERLESELTDALQLLKDGKWAYAEIGGRAAAETGAGTPEQRDYDANLRRIDALETTPLRSPQGECPSGDYEQAGRDRATSSPGESPAPTLTNCTRCGAKAEWFGNELKCGSCLAVLAVTVVETTVSSKQRCTHVQVLADGQRIMEPGTARGFDARASAWECPWCKIERLERQRAANDATRSDYNLRCDECGRAHILDTSIPSAIWNQIAPEGGVLCTVCIDGRMAAHGLECEAEFYFSGNALKSKLYEVSQGDIEAAQRLLETQETAP